MGWIDRFDKSENLFARCAAKRFFVNYPLFTKMQPLFDQLTALHGRLLRPKRIRLSYQKGKFMDNLLIIHESERREQNDDFSG